MHIVDAVLSNHFEKVIGLFEFLIFHQRMYGLRWKVHSYQVRVITVFTVFRLLTDFVCLYTYEF
jgi:hypothetical protein